VANRAKTPTTPPAGLAPARLRPVASLCPHPAGGLVPELDAAGYRDLYADIAVRGVQVPLEVTAAGTVLDGRARLRAAVELGLAEVAVRVLAPPDEVEFMVWAALHRRHLSASQRAAVAVDLDMYRHAAKRGEKRQRANLTQSASEVAELPPRGKTRDLAAGLAGVSARTIQDAVTVRAGDPELFQQVKEGKLAVDAAARRVRRQARDAGIAPPPPLPEGFFDLVYGDPPWRLGATDTERGPDGHYPTMTVEEIAAMKIPAAKDAVLFLWAVDSRLPEALLVMEAWGFTYVASFAWVKHAFGLGAWNRNQHEQLLVGKRGTFSPPPPDLRISSVINARRGRHSEKPAVVYELLERMYPHATKLELFARKSRPGWTAWGNQVPDA